jgi:hypothetical protein
MNTPFAILAHTAALVAVISAIQLTVLAFRNPFRRLWLRKSGVANLAAVAISAGFSIAAGSEVAGLVAAGVNAFVAIGVTTALTIVVAAFNWRVFRCGERLRLADAGRSPFEALTLAQKPQRAPAVSG